MPKQRTNLLALVLSPLLAAGCATMPFVAPGAGGPADANAMESPPAPESATLRSYRDFTAAPGVTSEQQPSSTGSPVKQTKDRPSTDPSMNHGTHP